MGWKQSGLSAELSATLIVLATVLGITWSAGAAADSKIHAAAPIAETEDPLDQRYKEAAIAIHNGDGARAFEIWLDLARQGHPKSQFAVGSLYGEGLVVKTDVGAAAEWWRKAAEQGHSGAQSNLGALYSEGLGVPRDTAEAVRLWRRAAEQGHMVAMYHLGGSYKAGRGVPLDLRNAHTWFMTAVLKGGASYKRDADQIAASLTPEELATSIADAEASAADCKANDPAAQPSR